MGQPLADAPQPSPASVNVKIHLAGIFSALLFWAGERLPRAGLNLSPVCSISSPSQAVCPGSWLAPGRDKMQKAEAVLLKYSTSRGTTYCRKPAEQSESMAYLISDLES